MIKAHVRPDSTKLLEGVQGIAVQTLPGGFPGRLTLFPRGWIATQDMLDNYWEWQEFADGTILPPSAALNMPRFLLFLHFATLHATRDELVPWLKAHADAGMKYAGYHLEDGEIFEFDATMSLFAATATAKAMSNASTFTNPTVLTAYRTAWDAVKNVALPF